MQYIILEIIPTSMDPKKGDIIQLSALKIDKLNLIDRFDYRLIEDKINFKKLLELIDYDNDKFTYKETTKEILDDFQKWCGNSKLLIIDNSYTRSYLLSLSNDIESILDYLNLEYSDDIIDVIMNKYNILPTNYIVDVLYEALIYENNYLK